MWNSELSTCSPLSSSPPCLISPGPPLSDKMNKYADYFFYNKYFYRPPASYWGYDYLVVIDFEATCDDTSRNDNPRPIRHERPEIIQFPAVLVDVWNLQVVGSFNRIVKPEEEPILSEFCTNLTGIAQNMVNEAAPFPEVLRQFEEWLKSFGIALSNKEMGCSFAIVTDGSYDMGHFLYKQCLISKIPYPSYANRWVNIRTIFSSFYRKRWGCLKAVLDLIGLPFEGRAHDGLDDSKNICNVLMHLLNFGCEVYQTEKILLQPEDQKRNEARILSDKSSGKYDLATVAPVAFKSPHPHPMYVYPPNMMMYHHHHQQQHHQQQQHQEYSGDVYEHPASTMPAMGSRVVEYCSSPQDSGYSSSTSDSCENIAVSGCNNKENSIPVHIPTKSSSSLSPFKSHHHHRASPVPSSHLDDVPCVSANGSSGSGKIIGPGGPGQKGGKRKKRHGQSKETANGLSPVLSGSSKAPPSPVAVAKSSGNKLKSADAFHHSHQVPQVKVFLDSGRSSSSAMHLPEILCT